MKLNQIFLTILYLSIGIELYSQKELKVSVFSEVDFHDNYGDLDTYSAVTDGYSPNHYQIGAGVLLQYGTVGIQLKKFDLTFRIENMDRPVRIIESTYDDFPRPFSGKGGGYRTNGYVFDGYAIGLTKTFESKFVDVELAGNYGTYQVKINGSNQSNTLYSYSYNTKTDFTSRHWAYYDAGRYFDFGVNLKRKIWKGIFMYGGVHLKVGSFRYVFRETVRDDLVEGNNLDSTVVFDKQFRSFGYKIGLLYVFDLRKTS